MILLMTGISGISKFLDIHASHTTASFKYRYVTVVYQK